MTYEFFPKQRPVLVQGE